MEKYLAIKILAKETGMTIGEFEKLVEKIKKISNNGYVPVVLAKESFDKKDGTIGGF